MDLFVKPVARGIAVAAAGLLVWQLVVWLTAAPHFILPGPLRVARRFWEARELIAEHAVITYAQILLGLALGVLLGVATALQMILSPFYRATMRPIIVFAQAIPVFALAPIITLWLGYGMASKVLIVVLIIYFPVASAFYDGLAKTPQGALDLARVMNAKPLNTVLRLRAPYAMPSLASGMRLAVAAAPFGAVIGEWVGASRGLGHMMLLANGRGQTDLMFACLFALAIFTVALYFAVDALGDAIAARYSEPTG